MYNFLKIEVYTTLFRGKGNVLMFEKNSINWKEVILEYFGRGRNYKRKSDGRQNVTLQKI